MLSATRNLSLCWLPAILLAGLAVSPAQAQRDRCNDYANELLSLNQRAQPLRCPGWSMAFTHDQLYSWCERSAQQVTQRALADFRTRFQTCQFAASGSPAAQQQVGRPAPAARASNGCPAPGSVRSLNSNTPATIQFANSTFRTVKIYWLNFQGERVFYRELRHGQDYRQPTYLTHPWIAVDPQGRCVDGVVRASGPGENLREFFGN